MVKYERKIIIIVVDNTDEISLYTQNFKNSLIELFYKKNSFFFKNLTFSKQSERLSHVLLCHVSPNGVAVFPESKTVLLYSFIYLWNKYYLQQTTTNIPEGTI